MAYVSKVWVDRQTEYPTRRKLEFADGGDDKIVTVSRAEGTIYEAGDVFSAQNMNGLESRINAGLNEKQNLLNAGSNITLTPQQDGTVTISAAGGGGGASDIDDLADVDITNPTNGQVLTYDSTSQTWKNAASGGGGGGGAVIDDTTTALDKTWSSSKIDSELDAKQGTLTAGDNISISAQNVISSMYQDNLVFGGGNLIDIPSSLLVNGYPYGFGGSDVPFGNHGFDVDTYFTGGMIEYAPITPFREEQPFDEFHVTMFYSDSYAPYSFQKFECDIDTTSTSVIDEIFGITISIEISTQWLRIYIGDATGATDELFITGIVLSPKAKWDNKDSMIQKYVKDVAAPAFVEVTGTLTAGNTSITLSNAAITTTSTLDIYTDVYGVNPKTVTVANGSVTMTFDGQNSALGVKVRVS